jgi:hypothetical protein
VIITVSSIAESRLAIWNGVGIEPNPAMPAVSAASAASRARTTIRCPAGSSDRGLFPIGWGLLSAARPDPSGRVAAEDLVVVPGDVLGVNEGFAVSG